jgi:DNA topoisomerase-1
VALAPAEEEVATFYATMLDTDFAKNPTFNKNFFRDWREILKQGEHGKKIKELSKCDFKPIYDWVMKDREEKKVARKESTMKKKLKEEKEFYANTYGFAIVDGYKEKVGNYRVEPPGLFRGRGAHPKTGTLKRRVKPEDIMINIGKGEKIPKAPDGSKWAGILHNNQVTWLAGYQDTFGNFKYIWLASSSRFKGQSDMLKYEKARKLKQCVDSIRTSYTKDMASGGSTEIKQKATAIYLIDKLALRVGNEKDKSEVADTVGCCSLRVEHVTFTEPNILGLDFLGKDSMRYSNEVPIDAVAYKNLKSFCKDKSKTKDVFDKISTASLNDHLKNLMDGLTAKVFRTYNASVTLEKELREKPEDEDVDADAEVNKKMLFYNSANREVAILCNHQRTVPKAHDGQMLKLVAKEKEFLELKEELEEALEGGKKKKKVKKEKEVKKEEDGVKKEKEKKPIPTDPSKIKAAIKKIEIRLDNHRTKMSVKEEGKTVALGTSKINYMDPRITVAWCKSKEVPIEKIFNKSLLSKFPWAMEVESSWRF